MKETIIETSRQNDDLSFGRQSYCPGVVQCYMEVHIQLPIGLLMEWEGRSVVSDCSDLYSAFSHGGCGVRLTHPWTPSNTMLVLFFFPWDEADRKDQLSI